MLSLVFQIVQQLLEQAMKNSAKGDEMRTSNSWPVLKRYNQDHVGKIALPIGGIGTGTVSLRGNGELRDWEIMNRPAKGFPGATDPKRAPFFAIWVKADNQSAITKALMGPIEFYEYEGMDGSRAINHGFPRFRQCRFATAYPFGQVYLHDQDMPVEVIIKAFNPLIPTNADDSGIPIAIFRYQLTNKTNKLLKISVCGSMENFIGMDGSKLHQDRRGIFVPLGADKNQNEFRKESGFQGIFMYSQGVDSTSEQWGTMALATDCQGKISYRTSFLPGIWNSDLLEFWDDFSNDGLLSERPAPQIDNPRASLAVKIELPPKETKEIQFFITWHFPNRYAWSKIRVGNYYTTQYRDAWDVLKKNLPRLPQLERKTIEWVSAFIHCDLPPVVKEAALFNLSTLRTQTCFRTADGRFFGWEGCNDTRGCCHGSCTHVWNYEQATAFLFGKLAKTMREVEFGYATNSQGMMSFRVELPLKNARQWDKAAAADGQMGCIMKMYRDWQLSGDDDFLRKMWPRVKHALEFCWIKGGWDGDRDGVMEGCQHNTMDVEYYGPNPQMELWYLGALRAAQEMASYLQDYKFAEKCRKLFEQGSKWTDNHLFNGEYYIHRVKPVASEKDIAQGLRLGMGAKDLTHPDFQLAQGCLVDQLVGQYMAHICGLGYLVKPEHIKSALQSIMKYNYHSSLYNHFNNMRSFALDDEAILVMASYPHKKPEKPFSYFSENMTGFEYTAAIGMLYEDMVEDGLKCIANIRNRYDGKKRNPFDEAEAGHHYARAMASWAAVLALTKFHYSAVTKSMEFAPKLGYFFWSTGYAYGTLNISQQQGHYLLRLKVLGGKLKLRSFRLKAVGKKQWKQIQVLTDNQQSNFKL